MHEGATMADGPTGDDERAKTAHSGTYDGFMGWLKWGVIIIAAILILMALFLA